MTTENTTTAVQRSDNRLPALMTQELRSIMGNIPALLPPDIPFEQFRAALWLELQRHEHMPDCTPASLVAAVVKAANAGLVPGRDCHLLPFRNKGLYEVTNVPNYGGIVLSLERTGKIRKAFAHAVYSQDHFEVDYLQDHFSHKPHPASQRGTLKCFYGCVLLKDGTRHFELMTLEQIDVIRRRAPRHDSGPWATDYEEMARKTALKRVAKYVRLAPQQRQLLDEDEERERTDPSPERFRENVHDLYGDPREIPNLTLQMPTEAKNPAPPPRDTLDAEKPTTTDPRANSLHIISAQDLIADIDAAWKAFGLTVPQISKYWDKACDRFEALNRNVLPTVALSTLLAETTTWVAKQPRKTSPQPDVAPTQTAWRDELLPLMGPLLDTLPGNPLLEDMYQAVNDETTPDDVGRAVLARAQTAMAGVEVGGTA